MLIAVLVAVALTIFTMLFVFFTPNDRLALFGEKRSISTAGGNREYRIGSKPDTTEHIVIGLHGFTGNSRKFAYYTALHNFTNDTTLVVYPDAIQPQSSDIKTGWNAGFCCGSGWTSKTDDVAFLTTLVEQLKKNFKAEEAKVYFVGFSNGAFMAQRMAAERPELVDGLAVSSGTIGTTEKRIEPSSPKPILLMHGEQDERVAYTGGANPSDPEFDWLSFEATKLSWQTINKEKAETKVITYPNNAHEWDGWRLYNIWHKHPNASKEAINFLESIQ